MRIITLLALCMTFIAQVVSAEDKQPNILLIIADQHTGKIMTQRGYEHINTPGIDKIADAGVTFTRAYTTYPVCRSFRKSFMTGKMPSKVTTTTDHKSISKIMGEAGYETVYHGKWHVGETNISKDEEWHGFDQYDRRQNDTGTRERIVDYIKQPKDKPFFMIASFMNPHDACELARNMSGIEDDYKDEPITVDDVPVELLPPLPANFDIPLNEAEGFSLRRNADRDSRNFWVHPTHDWSDEKWRRYLYGYDRLVEMVDAHIKLVVDELEEQGLLENTVIIYTSDHGDGHAAHKWNQKMTFYEESINVPFIVSWKGKTKAGFLDETTLSSTGIDIMPTILKLAGIPIPEELNGVDLSPAAMADSGEQTVEARDYVVSEIVQADINGRMVVTQDMKYILFESGENREQLFDLIKDPGELFPVTHDANYRDALLSHRNMLLDWDKKISDDDFSPKGKFPALGK